MELPERRNSLDGKGYAPIIPPPIILTDRKAKTNRSELSEEHEHAYQAMEKKVAEILDENNPWERKFADEACLLRYLRARNFDVHKSLAMFETTLKWRRDVLSKVTIDQVEKEAVTGKTYRHSDKDKLGRPIIVLKDRRQNTKDYEAQVAFTAYTFEKTVLTMDPAKGEEQWCLVIDFNGYSATRAPPWHVTRQVLDAMQIHYAERLGTAFLVDAPFLFYAVWKALSPFIDEKTKQKVRWVKGDAKREAMGEIIDVSVLESQWGGDAEVNYHHEEYWAVEKEQWEAMGGSLVDPRLATPDGKSKKKKKKSKKSKKSERSEKSDISEKSEKHHNDD